MAALSGAVVLSAVTKRYHAVDLSRHYGSAVIILFILNQHQSVPIFRHFSTSLFHVGAAQNARDAVSM